LPLASGVKVRCLRCALRVIPRNAQRVTAADPGRQRERAQRSLVEWLDPSGGWR
jgi:hypothetical protein